MFYFCIKSIFIIQNTPVLCRKLEKRMLIDYTADYNKRSQEYRLKRKLLRTMCYKSLHYTEYCASCDGSPEHTYPILLCNECFHILFTPKCFFEFHFYESYMEFKTCDSLKKLKLLADKFSSKQGLVYKNLISAVAYKAKKMIRILEEKDRIGILVEQHQTMIDNYGAIIDRMDLGDIITYKRAISQIFNEIQISKENLKKVK